MTVAEAKTGIAGMSDEDQYEVLKWMMDGMSDAQEVAFELKYYEDTGKEVMIVGPADVITGKKPIKKIQPSTGPGA